MMPSSIDTATQVFMKRFMPRVEQITIKVLAEKLSLGISTVSHALLGTGTLSSKTRDRVLEEAKKLGYKPNLHASALARRRSVDMGPLALHSVAVLYDSKDTLFERYNSELKAYTESLGFEFQKFNLKEYPNTARLGRMLRARGFTGIILDRVLDDVDLKNFPWEYFSVVAVGRQVHEWPFDLIRESAASTMRRLLLEANRRGYRRPGVCLPQHNRSVVDDWDRIGESLAYNYFHSSSDPVPPFYDKNEGNNDFIRHEEGARQWFRKYRPDVVIGFTVNYCYILRADGWKIPGDTSYAALLLEPSDPWQRDISGYVAGDARATRFAFERLAFLIRHNCKGLPAYPCEVVFKSEWQEGTTLPMVATTSETKQ